MGELLRDVFPPGVLNVVSGGDELGRLMSQHPVPRKVSFTGSVATGKAIFASAASDLKHLTLELGGNDAAIVLDDADPTEVGEKLFWKAFQNTGQICAAVKRIYVHERVAAGVDRDTDRAGPHRRGRRRDGRADAARPHQQPTPVRSRRRARR